MSQAEWSLLALQLGVILLLALGLGQLFRYFGQPSIVGELLGGILFGPTILGRISPDVYRAFLPTEGSTDEARNAVLRIGMLFFIFAIGADISLKRAFGVRREALSIGIAGTFTPLLLGFALALGLPGIIQAPPGREIALAGFLGAILSLSANPIIARILIDLDLYRERIGILIMSSTLIDDLVGWGLFAVLLAQFAPGRTPSAWGPFGTILMVLAVVGGVLTVGRFVVPELLRRTKGWGASPMSTLMVLMGFTLISAAAAESVGVHSFLGAFLAGLSLSDSLGDYQEAFESVSKFAIAVFTPIFFFCMGISADFIAGFDLVLTLLITFIAFFGKILGVYIGGRASGLTHKEGLAVGAGLNARGILGLLMAGSAFESGLIDQRMFVACVVMCLATTIVAGPALQFIMKGKFLPVPHRMDA
jgi:Kef-type K+ transport system membrane component KefB